MSFQGTSVRDSSASESSRLPLIQELPPDISDHPAFRDDVNSTRRESDTTVEREAQSLQTFRGSISSEDPSVKASRLESGPRNITNVSAGSSTWLLGAEGKNIIKEKVQDHKGRLWTPRSLHPAIFIILAVFFLLLIPMLEIMASFSRKHNGFSAISQGEHYLWNFGPPAVLSIAAVVWGRIEYRTKQLMPWREMASRPTVSTSSVSLDYISPLIITSFFKALKNKHFPVSVAILGNVLIKLLIVASTALLALQNGIVNKPGVLLQVTDSFGVSNFDPNLVSGAPSLRALAISRMGLPFPAGTFNQYAVQSFGLLGSNMSDKDYLITSNVDVFNTSLKCEEVYKIQVATMDCSQTGTFCPNRVNLTISSPSCDVQPAISLELDNLSQNASQTQRVGEVFMSSCKGTTSGTDSIRYVVITATLQYSNPNGTIKLSPQMAMVCQPTYSIQQAEVQLSATGHVANITAIPGNSRQISGISTDEFAQAVYNSVNMTQKQLSRSQLQDPSVESIFPWPASLEPFGGNSIHPFLVLMGYINSAADFGKIEDIQKSFEAVFGNVAAQVGRDYLTNSSSGTLIGSELRYERRLMIREMSLRIMEFCAAILFITTMALFFCRPVRHTPRDLSSLGGLATVLARSPRLVSSLKGMGGATLKQLRLHLSGLRFNTLITAVDGGYSFVVDCNNADEEDVPNRELPAIGVPAVWWNPLPDYTRVILLILCFGVITALELVHQRSQHDDGLSKLPPYKMSPWILSFIPAIFLTVFGNFFGIIDFYTRLLQPYHLLKKSPVPTRSSIMVNYLSDVSAWTIGKAITRKHFAVGFTALNAFLAPFLVIVSSGLFTGDLSPQVKIQGITMESVFDSSTVSNGNRSALPLLSSLVVDGSINNLFPAWTFGSYALPQLSLPPPAVASMHLADDGVQPLTTVLTVGEIPALISTMNCSQVPASDVKTYMVPITSDDSILARRFAVPVPDPCGAPCRSDDFANTCDGKSYFYGIDESNEDPKAVGGLYFGRVARIPTNTSSASATKICPQFSILYGKNSADGKTVDNMVVMNCHPFTSQVNIDAMFKLPNWTVVSLNRSANAQHQIIDDSVDSIVDLNAVFPPNPVANADFDPLFGTLFSANKTIKLNNLTSEITVDQVKHGLDQLYARVTAQNYNLNRRTPAPSDSPILNGTVDDVSRLRLVQDLGTTRALEVLLALMFLCAAVSYLLADTRKLLPANPCSIAVQSALLSDSEIIKTDMVPSGSEWSDDEGLRNRGGFEGYLFSLGVWITKNDGGKIFGINVGDAEKVD